MYTLDAYIFQCTILTVYTYTQRKYSFQDIRHKDGNLLFVNIQQKAWNPVLLVQPFERSSHLIIDVTDKYVP